MRACQNHPVCSFFRPAFGFFFLFPKGSKCTIPRVSANDKNKSRYSSTNQINLYNHGNGL